jgi:hypothetical protein
MALLTRIAVLPVRVRSRTGIINAVKNYLTPSGSQLRLSSKGAVTSLVFLETPFSPDGF